MAFNRYVANMSRGFAPTPSDEQFLIRAEGVLKITNADYIVGITGDCPFVDASIIDNAVKLIKEKKCDYLSNTLDRTYPDGIDVEVFSNAALNKAHKEAKHS